MGAEDKGRLAISRLRRSLADMAADLAVLAKAHDEATMRILELKGALEQAQADLKLRPSIPTTRRT